MGTGIEEVAIPAVVEGAEGASKGAEAGLAAAGAGADLLGPAGGAALPGFAGFGGLELPGFAGFPGFGGEALGLAGAESGAGAAPAAFDAAAGGLGSAPGLGAASFAPAPGVSLGAGIVPDATSAAAFGGGADLGGAGFSSGILPDATSAAGFAPEADLPFAARAEPAATAIREGVFDPVGAQGYTNFAGPGNPPTDLFPPGSTPTAPGEGVNALAQGGGAIQAGPGGAGGVNPGLDASGNPMSGPYGSNPQTPYGAVQPQYDPGGAGAVTQGASAGGDTSAISKAGQGALDSLTKNPLGIALGAGGLGLNLLNSKKQSEAMKNLQARAGKESATGDQLASYALNGTLPPGSQAGVDQAIAQAKSNAISNAAGQGLPTDPTKNTALAATLAKIDQQGPIIASQIATQLLTAGASFSGLSDNLYKALADIDQSQKASMGKAIANMAAAFNTGGTKIQIGGSA